MKLDSTAATSALLLLLAGYASIKESLIQTEIVIGFTIGIPIIFLLTLLENNKSLSEVLSTITMVVIIIGSIVITYSVSPRVTYAMVISASVAALGGSIRQYKPDQI